MKNEELGIGFFGAWCPMRQPLLTDRLMLRDVTETDAELLFELDSDPEVMRHIGVRPPPDVAWYRERIGMVYVPQQAHPWHGIRLVLERASGEFLGWVFVRPATASMHAREIGWTGPGDEEVGFRFRRSTWGRGIATEAAMPLVKIALADPATTAIVACALASNTRSLRVLEKLGLERVGEVMLPEANEATVKLAREKIQLCPLTSNRVC
jgi:RimJ/RimL family protein N-acetyltransferase